MAINERDRLALYDHLGGLLGPEHAGTLMELLPPTGWGDIVTRDDLALTSRELRAEMGGLRGEMGELRGELRAEMGGLRGELRAEMASQTRMMVMTMLGLTASVWITVLGAALLN